MPSDAVKDFSRFRVSAIPAEIEMASKTTRFSLPEKSFS
jgi:hypothetical protein